MVNFLKIAPSTDPVLDEDELLSYVRKLNGCADYVHCDVMSTNFVCKNSLSCELVKKIYLKTLLPLDVHLMINEPGKIVKKYIHAGAQIVTVHFEAFKNKSDLEKCLKNISKCGAIAGVAINPNTEISEVMPYIAFADLVLVMGVFPGCSGQRFKESTYSKIKKLKQIRDDYGARFLIEVDGGVVPEVSKNLKALGADIVVSGSFVFNAEDRANAIEKLK